MVSCVWCLSYNYNIENNGGFSVATIYLLVEYKFSYKFRINAILRSVIVDCVIFMNFYFLMYEIYYKELYLNHGN